MPTAHYMMGGVEFAPDCTTGAYRALRGRRGFGRRPRREPPGRQRRGQFDGVRRHRRRHDRRVGCAVRRRGASPTPRRSSARLRVPKRRCRADAAIRRTLESIRERLYDVMWDDAGIVRDGAGLARAARTPRIAAMTSWRGVGVPDSERAFNLTWHDALNLDNLIAVSRVDRARGDGAREFAGRALPDGFSRTRAISRRRRSSACGSATERSPRKRCRCASRASRPARRCSADLSASRNPVDEALSGGRRRFAGIRRARQNRRHDSRTFDAPACGAENRRRTAVLRAMRREPARRLSRVRIRATRRPRNSAAAAASRSPPRSVRARRSHAAAPPPVPRPRRDGDGERRPVTVLFADLVDYTRMSRALDPEDVHAMLERFYAVGRRDRRALRRQHRQAHRRFGDGGVRRPGRARRRRGARGAGRGRDPSRDALGRRRHGRAAGGAHRHRIGRGGRERPRQRAASRVHGDRQLGQPRGSAAEARRRRRDRARRSGARGDAARRAMRADRGCEGEGHRRAAHRMALRRIRRRRRAGGSEPVRRSRRGAGAARGDARELRRGRHRGHRVRPRRRRHRQVAARRRIAEPRPGFRLRLSHGARARLRHGQGARGDPRNRRQAHEPAAGSGRRRAARGARGNCSRGIPSSRRTSLSCATSSACRRPRAAARCTRRWTTRRGSKDGPRPSCACWRWPAPRLPCS